MDIKEINDIVDKGFEGFEGKMDGKTEKQINSAKGAVIKSIEEKGYQSAEQVETLIKEKTEELDKAVLELKKKSMSIESGNKKSFSSIIGDALEEKKDTLNSMVTRKGVSATLELKANEDLDPANWGTDALNNASTEFRQNVYNPPFAPIWLRNLLPNVTTTKANINYPRFNGNIGAAAIWDGSGAIADLTEKPGVSPEFIDVNTPVIWVAGITRVKRDMLDDVAWLRSFITQNLTTGPEGLFVAENAYLTSQIDATSTPYDGTNTSGIPVEMLYDAAFGQLRDNYLSPGLIIANSRDVVNLIALNKAEGSGEYDLPDGTVSVIGNQLMIGGVPVVGIPNVPAGDAYVMDTNQLQFVSRMSPEIRAFEEDRDNVVKNLITFRAEERIAFVNMNANAIVKVEFSTTT